jgi:acetyltransferase-like isoleucine patch superfamily enzyme
MGLGKIESFFDKCLRLKAFVFTSILSTQCGKFGKKSRILPPFRFNGLDQVSIGNSVVIGRDCWFITHRDDKSPEGIKLILGDNVSIGMGCSISAAIRVELQDHVLVARNVYISDHAHAFEDINIPIANQGITQLKPVVIGAGTWLGQNVCVLPGVTIGKHCVIGANSVVNSSLPDYCVAAGTPARIIRQYNPQTKKWDRVIRK